MLVKTLPLMQKAGEAKGGEAAKPAPTPAAPKAKPPEYEKVTRSDGSIEIVPKGQAPAQTNPTIKLEIPKEILPHIPNLTKGGTVRG